MKRRLFTLAFPHFTSCRLTERGARLAEQLLERHPEYRDIDQPRRMPTE
ncbi:MAG: hypothetical protein IH830_09095 [Planctomycetes bacterium]|nr:hypothetical protein [Planctomycetota bacterium]